MKFLLEGFLINLEIAAIGIVFTTLFALGLVLVSVTPSQVDLAHIVFGNVHVWTRDSNAVQRKAWIKTLDEISMYTVAESRFTIASEATHVRVTSHHPAGWGMNGTPPSSFTRRTSSYKSIFGVNAWSRPRMPRWWSMRPQGRTASGREQRGCPRRSDARR